MSQRFGLSLGERSLWDATLPGKSPNINKSEGGKEGVVTRNEGVRSTQQCGGKV